MSAPVYEPITGRYLRVDLLGKPHRVYVEEAGEGVPLLCLHTAGSDSRQWRGVMNDPGSCRGSGSSPSTCPGTASPRRRRAGEETEYRLTSRDYADVILGVADALGLDRPVAMGCSIGGRIVLHLALDHPERFGAVIGLQSAATSRPTTTRSGSTAPTSTARSRPPWSRA